MGLLVLMVALGISKAFDRVCHAGLAQKLTSYRIAGLSFLSNRRLQLILDGKSSQKYPVNAGVPQCSNQYGANNFPTIIKDLPDDVIYNIVIYADNTAHYSKCDQASDL